MATIRDCSESDFSGSFGQGMGIWSFLNCALDILNRVTPALIDLYWHIQKALIENMKQFILELGGDFIFIVVYRR
jgi:hypothetical protein